MFMIYNGGK